MPMTLVHPTLSSCTTFYENTADERRQPISALGWQLNTSYANTLNRVRPLRLSEYRWCPLDCGKQQTKKSGGAAQHGEEVKWGGMRLTLFFDMKPRKRQRGRGGVRRGDGTTCHVITYAAKFCHVIRTDHTRAFTPGAACTKLISIGMLHMRRYVPATDVADFPAKGLL